jgi:hypothetical protein
LNPLEISKLLGLQNSVFSKLLFVYALKMIITKRPALIGDSGTTSADMYEELRADFPEHIPIYIARLQALESEKERNLKAIVDTADLALKKINVSELLEFYGLKSDTRKDATKIKRYLDFLIGL